MALISAKTIITSLALFHIMLAFFFLTNPITVADQALVWIIGESMGMPYERSFENQSPALAFLAVILATMGLTDLVSLSLPEEICLIHHWGTQAPVRFIIALASTLYTFIFSPSSPLYRADATAAPKGYLSHPLSTGASANSGYVPAGWGGDGLKNRVFFAFAFVEMVSWLWVWVTLREERNEILMNKARRRKSESSGGGW